MDLYLVRHAIAEERRLGLADADRQLTDTGRQRFARVVAYLDGIGVRFDGALHSPWRRATQTAELLKPLVDGSLLPLDALAEDPGPELLAAVGGECMALIGHEPWLSELLLWLVTGSADAPAAISFKKGGIAWLRGEPVPGGMELRALMPPKAMGAI